MVFEGQNLKRLITNRTIRKVFDEMKKQAGIILEKKIFLDN
jgi:hypothetical protein